MFDISNLHTTMQTKNCAICEDCGIRWEAVCLDISVNLIVENTEVYCEELDKEDGRTWPQSQLCLSVFRPSLAVGESSFTLSCITPRKNLGYTWRINHSALGSRAHSGCQIIPVPEKPPQVPILKKILTEPYSKKAADQDINESISNKESILEKALTVKKNINKEKIICEGSSNTSEAKSNENYSENNNNSLMENNMSIGDEEEYGEVVVKEEVIEDDVGEEQGDGELDWQMNHDNSDDSSQLTIPSQEKIVNINTLESVDWANILGNSAVSAGLNTTHNPDGELIQEPTATLPPSIKAAIDFIALSQQLQQTITHKRRPGRPGRFPGIFPISHEMEKGIECGVCGKKYESRYKLKLHMNSHTGERPFICEICGVGFSRGPNLNAHRRVHSNFKPFKCTRCDTGFRHPSDRMVHMVTEVCTKWAKHIKKTESGGWLCVTCGESFANQKVSQHHSRQHETGRALCCPVCKENFRGQKAHALIKHLKLLHPDYISSLGL